MKNSERAKGMTKDQIYEMLMQQTMEYEAKRAKARKMFENAPTGGWTDADRVK